MTAIKAGFVGFGEVNTPREFIDGRCEEARKQIESLGIETLWTAPVSDDPEGKDVRRALGELKGREFDLLIVCVAGWIPSHAVISVIEPFKHVPILLWGLSGWKDGERWVTTADQAGTTALRKPIEDMGYRFKYVVNLRGQEPALGQVASFAKAAYAARRLRSARIGMMGYRDMDLYATLHDGVSLRGQIGPEVESFETLEIARLMDKLGVEEVDALAAAVKDRWTFVKEPAEGTVEQTARLFLAVKQKVAERGYEAVSLKDVDGVKKFFGFAPAGAFMLVHEELDICTIPENDTLGAVTQLMTRYLTGQAAPYLEFYDFLADGVVMGVPDYVPSQVVDGPVTVMPTSFGEFGEGLLNVSKLKTGPVTIARLTHGPMGYELHCVRGEARTPEPWEEAGWSPPAPQLPSLEVALEEPIEVFAQKVLSQHYIVSYGDTSEAFADLCGLLGVRLL